MIWLNGSQVCLLLSSRCWRHKRTLVNLLAIYCSRMTFMVCEHSKSTFCALDALLTSLTAASHQYYCLAKQLLINHAPKHEEHLMAPLGQSDTQTETIDLLRRACAVAESHTNTMGIVLMSTLPILACKYHSRLPIEHRNLNLADASRRSFIARQRVPRASFGNSAEGTKQFRGTHAAWDQ